MIQRSRRSQETFHEGGNIFKNNLMVCKCFGTRIGTGLLCYCWCDPTAREGSNYEKFKAPTSPLEPKHCNYQRLRWPSPGRFLEFHNATFRFVVPIECVGPHETRLLAHSTSCIVHRFSCLGQKMCSCHLSFYLTRCIN